MDHYWILLANGASRTREWQGLALDEDSAIELAERENPGYDVHTIGAKVI